MSEALSAPTPARELSAARAPGREPELTLRALLAGCVLGAALAAANVYSGLQTGFVDGGNITASVLAFATFATFRRSRPYSALENNLTQTIAASAAVMSIVAGVAGPIPALEMSGYVCPPWAVIGWGVALGAIGIVIALALRGRLIGTEALPFPTGAATAEVIAAMAAGRHAALRRARALLLAAMAAALLTWLRDGPAALVPATLFWPGTIAGVSAASLSLGVSVSPLMFGTGLLAGVRAGVGMLLGSVIAWVGIAPALVRAGWVEADHQQLVQWLMWPGAAFVLSSALTSLFLHRRALLSGLRDLRTLFGAPGARSGPASLAKPVLLGMSLVSVAIVVAIAWTVFGLAPPATLLALAVSVLLATVCARSAGETDIAPVGTMGGVTQLLFGASSSAASLACGAIVAGTASQTAATLWALKAGQQLGASARVQLLGQLLGGLVGALVVVPVYALLDEAYGVGSERMPAPGALSWKATADAVQLGAAAMPSQALIAAALALAAGSALTRLAETRWARLAPSPVALGIAFLLPPALSVTLFLGSLSLALLARRAPGFSADHVASIAGGAIAGESLLAVAVAVLIAAGLLPG